MLFSPNISNYEPFQLSTDFDTEKDRSECVAWRRFSAGEQIFIFYGARPNCEFLVHNGFVPPENEYDTLALRLGISHADPLGARKKALLDVLGLPFSGEFLLCAGAEPVDSKLRTFLRVFSMTEGTLKGFWPFSVKMNSMQFYSLLFKKFIILFMQ